MILNKIYRNILLAVPVSAVLFSCKIREDYKRPENLVDKNLYRTDLLPKDSTGIGQLSWREIFTDAPLQKHIETALQNNLDIRIALQNITAAESYLKQAKSAYQPTISVGPEYGISTPSLNTSAAGLSGKRRYGDNFDFSSVIAWEPDIWGKLSAQERAQQAEYLSTLAAHKIVKSDLVASIASSYYQILAYDEQKRILTETIAIRKKNLETTRALKQAGVLTEVAVQQSEALVYNAESLLINIDTQIALLENTISLLKGEPSQEIERSTLSAQQTPYSIETGFPAALLANRPDVMQAEYGLVNAWELTNAAKASFYPTFRITAGGGLTSGSLDNFFSASSLFGNIMGGLTAPLLNQRKIRTQYEVSLANREKALLNFKKTILSAGKEVSDAIKVYSTQDAFISLKEKELSNYKKSVEYSQELVNYGMANYLEVLNSSVNSLNAELNIANAKYSKLKAGVELYQALGGGWK